MKHQSGKLHITIPVTDNDDNKQSATNCSLHSTMSFVLLLAQLFGLMPLYGITNNNVQSIKFNWKSLRFVYTVLNLIGAFTSAIFCLVHFGLVGLQLDKTATLSFYICTFFGTLQFIQIARNWGTLIEKWTNVETSMKNYGYPSNLKRRFQIMTAVVMTLALFEHLLFILNAINASMNCENIDKYPTEIYFGTAFPHVFTVTSFRYWKAILVESANILTTFSWNFTDLIIMLLSSALALRFKQINERLQTSRPMHHKFWREIREDYNRLASLCCTLDQYIAPLVTISFINNTFFICIQLYNSLKPRYGLIEGLYFFYSFGFLLARTMAVSLYAAWINDESQEPLSTLHAVSTEYYCTEINRLVQQIHTCTVGVTGCKFFHVTRNFLLRVAGTIVTFELMLLQFGPLLHDRIIQGDYTSKIFRLWTVFFLMRFIVSLSKTRRLNACRNVGVIAYLKKKC